MSREDVLRGLLRWGLTLAVLVVATAAILFVGGRLLEGETVQEVDSEAVQMSSLERTLIGLYLRLRRSDLQTRASADDTAEVFTVNPGETAATIAPRLDREGLVSDGQLFLYLVRYRGVDAQLEAGEYELRPNMTMDEIIDTLQHGRLREVSITIPEGKRAEEVAELLEERGISDGEEFLSLVRAGSSAYGFLGGRPEGASSSLEGYLFPETYRIPADYDAAAILDLLLATFGERFSPEMRQAAADKGMTVHEVVTLASIVEREAVVPEERPIIASVYLNRLAQGMYLQSDPTVQYALGYQEDAGQWWKIPMSLEEDVVVDSPYNTYMYPGLPPGPLCSPGLASIEAVLEPAETPYLFFYSKFDGSHAFAETYEEHLLNQERYQGQPAP
ncbi:MAG TPA: endolytic transglycosylase MltG [Anaerolineae bacterium]|nr:endolytic transglycosylase MltG [Anaerolineae bacterium]